MSARITPVVGGTFECPYCGARWVGTWHGDTALMTCPRCEKPLREALAGDAE